MVGRHKFAIAGWIALLIGFFTTTEFIYFAGFFVLEWRFVVWFFNTRLGKWGMR